MAITSAGIGSNLDVEGIITKLMTVERQPLTGMATKEASYQAQLTAYGTLKGSLSSFQSSLSNLNTLSRYTSLTSKVADSSVLTASASSTAVAGSHSVEVQTLAQSQKLRTNFNSSDVTAAVGSGSLTFYFGTWDGSTFTPNSTTGAKTVTIDAAHNSMSGIRDAINSAGIGVTASIINDGTTNRLVFSSDNPGAANSLKITTSDADGNNTDMSGLSVLAYDPAGTKNMVETVQAQNATLLVDGVAISKSSNTISDAIQGVTLNLIKTNLNTPTTVTVSRDTSTINSMVSDFVKGFNEVNKTIASLTSYDSSTKQAGVLLGDATVQGIQRQLRAQLMNRIKGPDGNLVSLADIGVSFQKDGTLSLDSTKLQKAINTNPDTVAAMFAAMGTPTDSLVKFTSSTVNTQVGSYDLNLTQLASQGKTVGSAVAGLTITAGVNDTLNVTVDGILASVTLGAGTYASTDALVAEVQSKINGASAISNAGVSVSVSHSGGILTVLSNRYGSASNVSLAGNGAANLLGGSPTATAGTDVAGTIGGYTASGSGQYLAGTYGAVNGLTLQINGGVTGSRGSVAVTQGYAFNLDRYLSSLLSSTGALSSRTDGINQSIKDLEDQATRFQTRMTQVEARYRKQFTALDSLISQMNQTSTYLSQQLANLPKAG